MRTEITNTYNQATLQGYKESGIVKQYEYLATLDLRTSAICADLDNDVFDIDKAVVGLNYPPMHPNCRSTTVAKFDDEVSTRRARAEDGTTYTVPSNMSYKEWDEIYNKKSMTIDEWKNNKFPKNKKANKNIMFGINDTAKQSSSPVDFWMNMSSKQQNYIKDSGLSYKDIFNAIPKGKISQWKKTVGSVDDFKLTPKSIDFDDISVKFIDTGRAEAHGAKYGIIEVKETGLGENWKNVMDHEIGHQLSNGSTNIQRAIVDNYGDAFGRYNVERGFFDGVFGEFNPEEAFATSFSTYINNPKELLKRYPDAYKAVDNIAKSVTNLDSIVSEFENKYLKGIKK